MITSFLIGLLYKLYSKKNSKREFFYFIIPIKFFMNMFITKFSQTLPNVLRYFSGVMPIILLNTLP